MSQENNTLYTPTHMPVVHDGMSSLAVDLLAWIEAEHSWMETPGYDPLWTICTDMARALIAGDY